MPSFAAIYNTNTEKKKKMLRSIKTNKNKKQQQQLGPEMRAHTCNPSKGIIENQTEKRMQRV